MSATNKLTLCTVMLISFLSVSVCAQSAGTELNHFSADGISFDYPSGFSLNDESTPEAKQLTITRKGTSIQLTIVGKRDLSLERDMPAAGENFKEALVKTVALTLQLDRNSSQPFETQIGTKQAEGVRLQSASRTGEVIWLRWNLRLVGVTLVRANVDESVGSELWQAVSSSLKVESPVILGAAKGDEPPPGKRIEGGVLNGKALALPPPAYPPIARAAHASGTVLVQVLIDEQGNVVSAHAVEGHPLLQAAAVNAARQAQFSPTFLEGQPVKVTGVIQYNFVSQ